MFVNTAINNKSNLFVEPAIIPLSAAVNPTGSVDIGGGAVSNCQALYQKLPQAFRDGALKLMSPNCITVTGKVTWIHACPSDGDFNVNVLPDPPGNKYVFPANSKRPFITKYPDSAGNIHCEFPCQCTNNSADPFKKTMCKDNQVWPKILRAKIGDRVQITGAWVQDVREGGHAEIHPASSLTIL